MRQLRLVVAAAWATAWRRVRRGPRRRGWTFLFEFVIEVLRRDWAELRDFSIAEARADLARKPVPRSASKRVACREIALGGVRCLELVPPDAAPDRVLLYLHGGSYLFGSPETHLDITSRFALAARARTIVPDYRLAPEHPYPAALDDAASVMAALAEEAASTSARIAVAGESAGGNLAIELALRLRDAGMEMPSALVACSPWLDLAASSPSTHTHADDYGDREMLVRQASLFAGGLALDDPRISPLYADLAGLPRTLVQVGGAERLYDEAIAFTERAKQAGVDVTLEVLPEMPHAPQLLAEWSEEGRRAIDHAGELIIATSG